MDKNIYYDDKNNNILKREILTTEAKKLADTFIGQNDRKPLLKSTQLRKFYNEFKYFEKKLEDKEFNNFNEIKPLIKMMESKAEYASNAKKVRIPLQFKSFIVSNVRKIEDEFDFKGFLKHFEAILGFYYGRIKE